MEPETSPYKTAKHAGGFASNDVNSFYKLSRLRLKLKMLFIFTGKLSVKCEAQTKRLVVKWKTHTREAVSDNKRMKHQDQ